MNPGRDPGLLRPDERVAEVAALLAVGALRLAQKLRNGLAAGADAEAQCAPVLSGTESLGTRSER